MKVLILLALCAFAAASTENRVNFVDSPIQSEDSKIVLVDEPVIVDDISKAGDAEVSANRNILINVFIRTMITQIRNFIKNGDPEAGFPPLDPLYLNSYDLRIPAGIVNLELDLKKIHSSGIGGFVVHTSDLKPKNLTFDLDISVPEIIISAEHYSLDGDLFTAIPVYGDGSARFELKDFRFKGLLHLKQCDQGRSVIIDRIENASFRVPHFKTKLTGVIGGGDIDQIVSLMIDEVIVDYVNRFQGIIAKTSSEFITVALNPILENYRTWALLRPFL